MALTRPTANQIVSTSVDFTDPLIRLNKAQSGANDKDIGIVFERGSDTNTAFIWDESADQFALINTTEIGTTSGNVSISSYSNVKVGNLEATNITGTLTTAAQPNITSVGTLTSLTTSGDVQAKELFSTNSSGDEGGQINLAKPATNSTISGTGVIIDVYQNKLRIFEEGGSARGAYIDLTTASNSVGSNILGSSVPTAIVNGTSNVSVASNANITVNVAGNANIATFASTGVDITGSLTVSSKIIGAQGSGTTGGYSFGGTEVGNDTGMFSNADGVLDFYADGNKKLTLTSANLTFTGNSTFSGGVQKITVPPGELGTNTGEVNTLQIYQATGNTDAFQTFHVNGDYAVHFGLDGTTHDLFVGGWQMGAVKNKIWHAGNDGTGSGLDADTVDGYNPATASTANTIVLRDTNANFSANVITATSTSARYADLAENYLADRLYPIGTVLMVGGEQEVTVAVKDSLPVIGTVSENPGYLMNSELCGNYVTPVAYIGRVPCRVVGDVKRGDRLSPSDIPGVAQATSSAGFGQSIGVALENYNDTIEGLIEILVGR